jgi:hypothetical protein
MKKMYAKRAKEKIKIETIRVKNSIALPVRAQSVSASRMALNGIFLKLFSDDNFVTLLRAESMTAIPAYLQPLVKEGTDEHESN